MRQGARAGRRSASSPNSPATPSARTRSSVRASPPTGSAGRRRTLFRPERLFQVDPLRRARAPRRADGQSEPARDFLLRNRAAARPRRRRLSSSPWRRCSSSAEARSTSGVGAFVGHGQRRERHDPRRRAGPRRRSPRRRARGIRRHRALDPRPRDTGDRRHARRVLHLVRDRPDHPAEPRRGRTRLAPRAGRLVDPRRPDAAPPDPARRQRRDGDRSRAARRGAARLRLEPGGAGPRRLEPGPVRDLALPDRRGLRRDGRPLPDGRQSGERHQRRRPPTRCSASPAWSSAAVPCSAG